MKPLDDREPKTGERFLSRWSRLKRGSRGEPPPVEGATAPAEGTATGGLAASVPSPTLPVTADARRDAAVSSRAAVQPTAAPQDDVVAALPSIDSLTVDSDYAPFFQPKVPEALRRAAAKKLFADPHFNVMDGLDTYIDDYTKPDPIPDSMLRSLNHAQGFFAPVADPGEPSAANPSAVATVTDSTATIADPTASDASNGAADATRPDVAASNAGARNEAPDPLD